jgi:carbonic anhydrase
MFRRSLLALVLLPALALPSLALGLDRGPALRTYLDRLKLGNARFAADIASPVDLSSLQRQLLTNNQHPWCTVLGCADSRVPPEHLFSAGLGDIFDVRVAGNVVDSYSLASVEYAVDKLHSPVLVVLGHADCGAVKAWLAGEATWPNLDALLKLVGPPVPAGQPQPSLEEAVKANVTFQLAALLKSDIVAKAVADRSLLVKPAYYDLDSGKVIFLDEVAVKPTPGEAPPTGATSAPTDTKAPAKVPTKAPAKTGTKAPANTDTKAPAKK